MNTGFAMPPEIKILADALRSIAESAKIIAQAMTAQQDTRPYCHCETMGMEMCPGKPGEPGIKCRRAYAQPAFGGE